jgi:hypothetical protein
MACRFASTCRSFAASVALRRLSSRQHAKLTIAKTAKVTNIRKKNPAKLDLAGATTKTQDKLPRLISTQKIPIPIVPPCLWLEVAGRNAPFSVVAQDEEPRNDKV